MSRLYITEDGHVEDSYLVIPFDPATQKIQQLREMSIFKSIAYILNIKQLLLLS